MSGKCLVSCAIVLLFVPSPSRASPDRHNDQTSPANVQTQDRSASSTARQAAQPADIKPADIKKDAPSKQAEGVQTDAQQRVQVEGAVNKPAARPVIVSPDGILSVTAPRLRIRDVLNEISVQTKVAIVLAEALEEERVTLQLRGVPLDEGLKQLLAAYDAFYLYSASDSKSPGSIKAIWIYPRGEGRELEPVPPTLWASTKELEERLDDPDPGVRSDTLEALIERNGDRALPTVLKGLSDPEESVRLLALQTALDAGVNIPSSDLHAVVLADQSPYVRRLALEAAEATPEAEAIATSVKDDADEVIRNQARLILKGLEKRAGKKPQP